MDVREAVLALAAPLAQERGLVLIDVEYHPGRRSSVLRLVLDRAGGIGLDDLEGFHRAIDPLLDEADPVPGSYMLEVSSPGAERPLRSERDFTLFAGRQVLLAAREPVQGRREWRGRLLGMEDGAVRVVLADGQVLALALELVAWARLTLDQGARG